MKKIFVLILLLVCSVNIFSQNHVSVDLNDPVYEILEIAQNKGACSSLPASKPYARSAVLKALNECLKNKKMFNALELNWIKSKVEELDPEVSKPWFQTMSYREAKDDLSIEFGLDTSFKLDTGFLDTNAWALTYDLGFFFQGDLGKNVSYYADVHLLLMNYDQNAFEPYTFSKPYDGFLFPIGDWGGKHEAYPDGWSMGFSNLSEFNCEFLDNKVGLRLSRMRHDWGVGMGNLLLSETSRPFSALELYVNPASWFKLSSMVGVLEYGLKSHIKNDAEAFQNGYHATLLEIIPCDWIYFNLFESMIFSKRFELGYMNPGTAGTLHQNNIGDFDNLQTGFTAGFNVPGWTKLYFSMNFDEIGTSDIFKYDRNMFSLQGGMKFFIPGLPFTSFNVQYTKIEPYMYTHPPTDNPWYEGKMNNSYVNSGEGLAYILKPNSDELILEFETNPAPFVSASLSYRMIRHFADETTEQGYGSSYDDFINYSENIETNPKYLKDFLKDGVYEWYHILGLEGKFDLRSFDIPVSIGIDYSFTYKYYSEYNGEKVVKIADNSTFPETFQNNLTLWFDLF